MKQHSSSVSDLIFFLSVTVAERQYSVWTRQPVQRGTSSTGRYSSYFLMRNCERVNEQAPLANDRKRAKPTAVLIEDPLFRRMSRSKLDALSR